MRIFRNFIAVLAGVFLGSLIIYALQAVGQFIFPPPDHYDPAGPEMLRKLTPNHQLIVLMPILFAYVAGSFFGGFFSGFLSKGTSIIYPILTGFILLLFTLVNMINFYHPVWFWVASIVVYFGVSLVGGMVSGHIKRP